MDTLAASTSTDAILEPFEIGRSYEGRELKGLKITGSSGFGGDKGIAVYNCGIDFTLSLLR
jgi:hypothetical protein